jgi:hypothetical protein
MYKVKNPGPEGKPLISPGRVVFAGGQTMVLNRVKEG